MNVVEELKIKVLGTICQSLLGDRCCNDHYDWLSSLHICAEVSLGRWCLWCISIASPILFKASWITGLERIRLSYFEAKHGRFNVARVALQHV